MHIRSAVSLRVSRCEQGVGLLVGTACLIGSRQQLQCVGIEDGHHIRHLVERHRGKRFLLRVEYLAVRVIDQLLHIGRQEGVVELHTHIPAR